MDVEEFDGLLKAVESAYEEQEKRRLGYAGRKRGVGGGAKFKLGVGERLLMTLMAARLYVENGLLGYLFGLDESNVGREINHRMRPVLLEVLPTAMQDEPWQPKICGEVATATATASQPKRKKIGTLEELLEKHPEFKEVLVDASEQEVPKPKDKLQRRQRYSGKRKKHALKFQVVVSQRLVLHLTKAVPGSVHDHTLLRASGVMHHLRDRTVRVDKGYEGIEDEYPGNMVLKPRRARRNHLLNPLEKIINQALSSLRMPVEHLIGALKRFRILADPYRGSFRFYDQITALVAGIHNFKTLGSLSW